MGIKSLHSEPIGNNENAKKFSRYISNRSIFKIQKPGEVHIYLVPELFIFIKICIWILSCYPVPLRTIFWNPRVIGTEINWLVPIWCKNTFLVNFLFIRLHLVYVYFVLYSCSPVIKILLFVWQWMKQDIENYLLEIGNRLS